MPTTYTATATGEPVLQTTIPSDGDARDASSVNVAFEGLADDISRLAKGGMTSATVTRSFAHFEYTAGAINAWIRYRSTVSTYTSHWSQSSTTEDTGAGDTILWGVLDLPHGARLAAVFLSVASDGTHAALPETMPSFTLYQQHLSSGVVTILGTATDSSATVAAYEAPHQIGLSVSPNHVVDRETSTYLIAVSGEYGTNSDLHLHVFGGSVVLTSSSHDQGAG
jgi:hypothetical protein